MKLYALRYNNYYNRILKKFDTIAEYLVGKTQGTDFDIQEHVSFNPNDGVTTSQVVNFDASKYDYLVACSEPNTLGQSDIISRWFIIEAQRTRSGQYQLQLQRDIVADNYEDVIQAPVFIEKATVGLNDSAIFNAEDMTFNEIKSKETLLKDGTESAWIALYFAQGLESDIEGSVTINAGADIDLTTIEHTRWQYYDYSQKELKPDNLTLSVGIYSRNDYQDFRIVDLTTSSYKSEYRDFVCGYTRDWAWTGKDKKELYNKINPTSIQMDDIYLSFIQRKGWTTTREDLEKFNHKTIAFSDGVYLCEVIYTSGSYTQKSTYRDPTDEFIIIKNRIEATFDESGMSWSFTGNNNSTEMFKLTTTYSKATVKLTKVEGKGSTYTYKINHSHHKTEDVPYDIVLLPYNNIKVKADNTWTGQTALSNISLLVAKDIIEKNKGSSKLIDAQIVPYFSEPELILNNPIHPDIKLSLYDDGVEDSNYNKIVSEDDSHTFGSFIWYPKKASFTNRITVDCGTTNVAGITPWTPSLLTETDIKVAIETEKLRICSPNYNGIFEFQPIKAGIYNNEIEFDLDCTYMPQTPYIHVAPVFNGRLYGIDYDDARGLICGGDFSMAQSSDAWETYKAQNKNYQIAFNRQIENLEVHQSYQRLGDVVGMFSGAIQGGATGAQVGFQSGGPYGAMAGAVVGGGIGLVGGAADMAINERLRKEAMDYTKDNFGYHLGNIKALPDSLVKLPAQVYNNKYFPFVEFYTCTEEEKEALRNKIKYNGMTIMRIGNINDYIKSEETYIKGQLIRSETINCDEHELQAIAMELHKGLFMKG